VMMHRGRMTVFDFEDTIVGYPEHDLVVALYGPYFNRDDFDDVVAALRAGYERVAPWPIDDMTALAPLFAARCVLLMDYCVLMGPELYEWLQLLSARVESFLREPTRRTVVRAEQ
jgi:Ser/Thr protein kinase RdoA (MazF antagonist)